MAVKGKKSQQSEKKAPRKVAKTVASGDPKPRVKADKGKKSGRKGK